MNILDKLVAAGITSLGYIGVIAVGLNPILQPSSAYAQQIIVDPNAVFAPGLSTTSTGTPSINIVAPQSGVSLNQFTNFNVTADGLVLNNSTSGASTNLGNVGANPNLAGGAATTIVNEVTSSNQSALNGQIIVGGQKADVIVANPNGISCDGCVFVNAGSASITTGAPIIAANGGIVLKMQQGNIMVGRGGISADEALSISGRHVLIDGPVQSSDELLVSGGNYSIDMSTGVVSGIPSTVAATSVYAVDATEFGAMDSGGRIRVFGRSADGGVRVRGDINAPDGQARVAGFRISVNNISARNTHVAGWKGVEVNGDLVATHGKVTLTSGSGNVVVQPSASATALAGHIVVEAAGNFENHGDLSAKATITITASGDILNTGFILAESALTVAADGAIHNERTVIDTYSVDYNRWVNQYENAYESYAAAQGDSMTAVLARHYLEERDVLDFVEQVTEHGGSLFGSDVSLEAIGDITNIGGAIVASGDLSIISTDSNILNHYVATKHVNNSPECSSQNCADRLEFQPGEILAGNDVFAQAKDSILVNGSDIGAGNAIVLSAIDGDVGFLHPSMDANGMVEEVAPENPDNTLGYTSVFEGLVSGYYQRLLNRAGSTVTQSDLPDVYTTLDRRTRIAALGGDLSVFAGDDIYGIAPTLSAGGDILLQATDDIIFESYTVQGQELKDAYSYYAWREKGIDADISGNVSGTFYNATPELTGKNITLVAGGNIKLLGAVGFAQEDLNFEAGGDLIVDGAQQAFGFDGDSTGQSLSLNNIICQSISLKLTS